MKIKKNDNVRIIAGKDKGKEGKVLRSIPESERVVVEGINIRTKHRRASRDGMKGEKIELAAPIHVSNVMIIDPKTKKPTRVGYKKVAEKKVRIARGSGAEID
jgi:large subunit ribosomal protein L24